mmetsp:Transcript_4750/g.7098  ORF Transcript_4750/g.7098 Transcript_4750/m.7098 type:complete len:84 (-) Transcript_4750:796-1047(-)
MEVKGREGGGERPRSHSLSSSQVKRPQTQPGPKGFASMYEIENIEGGEKQEQLSHEDENDDEEDRGDGDDEDGEDEAEEQKEE